MKQDTKFKIIIFATVCFVGFGALSIYSFFKAFNNDPSLIEKVAKEMKFSKNGNFNITFKNDDESTVFGESASTLSFTGQAKEIKIKAITANIKVEPAEGEEIVVKAKGQLGNKVTGKILKTSFVTETLTIEEPDDQSTKDVTIDVFVPKSLIKNLLVRSISGDIKIENVNLQKVVIETVSGNVKLSANQQDSVEIKSVSGNVKVAVKNPEDINPVIETISGKIKNELTISGKGKSSLLVKTVSGDVKLQKQ